MERCDVSQEKRINQNLKFSTPTGQVCTTSLSYPSSTMGNSKSVEQVPYIVLDEIVTFVDIRSFRNLLPLCKSLRVHPPFSRETFTDGQEKLDSTRYGGDYRTFWTKEPGAMKQLLCMYSSYPD